MRDRNTQLIIKEKFTKLVTLLQVQMVAGGLRSRTFGLDRVAEWLRYRYFHLQSQLRVSVVERSQ